MREVMAKLNQLISFKKLFVSSIVGIVLYFSVSYIFSLYYNHSLNVDYLTIFVTILLTIFFMEIIRFTNGKIDQTYKWSTDPRKRFRIQLLFNLAIVITILSTVGPIVSFYIAGDAFISVFDMVVINIIGVILVLIVVGGELIIFLLNNWRDSLVEIEKFKKENAEAKLLSLKNQLSPHFLFNNLNTLYGLIKEDTSLASDYLLKLSEIYRYVLKIKDYEVVVLKDEIDFIKGYIFLLSTRYGNSLKVVYHVEDNLLKEKYLPPLTLQLLIENVQKHNIIDDLQPLEIRIYTENSDYIVVENSLAAEPVKVLSTNVGIENLKSRYHFLTDKKMIILSEDDKFIVKVPLLELTS